MLILLQKNLPKSELVKKLREKIIIKLKFVSSLF